MRAARSRAEEEDLPFEATAAFDPVPQRHPCLLSLSRLSILFSPPPPQKKKNHRHHQQLPPKAKPAAKAPGIKAKEGGESGESGEAESKVREKFVCLSLFLLFSSHHFRFLRPLTHDPHHGSIPLSLSHLKNNNRNTSKPSPRTPSPVPRPSEQERWRNGEKEGKKRGVVYLLLTGATPPPPSPSFQFTPNQTTGPPSRSTPAPPRRRPRRRPPSTAPARAARAARVERPVGTSASPRRSR